MAANASGTTSNQHNLLVPVIFILSPVIEDTCIEIRGDNAGKAPVEQELDAREGGFV
jgi:hypothetical protein